MSYIAELEQALAEARALAANELRLIDEMIAQVGGNQAMNTEDAIKAAAGVFVGAALDLIQADPHQWSDRPCPTCRTVSGLVGRSFGCCQCAAKKRFAAAIEKATKP